MSGYTGNRATSNLADIASQRLATTEEELASRRAEKEPHPPSRHCMCEDCRPSFDDSAVPKHEAGRG